MFFIIVLYLVIAAIILFLLIKIQAVIHADNNRVSITIVIFGFIKIKKKFIILREEKEIFTLYQLKKRGRKKVISLYNIICKIKNADQTEADKKAGRKALEYLLKRAVIKIYIRTLVGTTSAYATAMLCGFFNMISSIVKAVLSSRLHNIEIIIKPFYTKEFFSLKANCIIAIAPANIIIGTIIYKKRRGGK